MTIALNFNPKQEAILRERAARAGQEIEEYVHDLILRYLDEPDAEEASQAQK